jgi:thioredoxin-dependent peroxiredoxin
MPAKNSKRAARRPSRQASATATGQLARGTTNRRPAKRTTKVAVKSPIQPSEMGSPKFKAFATSDKMVSSADLKGTPYVIYFYPKDNTSGCTLEGETFRDYYKKFKAAGVEVFGVSRDSLESHEKFKAKHGFPFDLISDEDEKVCKTFDVIKMKSLYGRKYLGIERSTFFVNDKGVVIQEWRNIKVPGHVERVLEFAVSFSQT